MENLIQRINQVKDRSDSRHLFLLLEGIYRALNSQFVTSAGLRIGGTTSRVRTAATASMAIVNGVPRSVAGGAADLPALVGTVVNDTFNIFLFTLDAAGDYYTQMGTAGATLQAVKWPPLHKDRTIVGYVVINPTGTGDFVGGTTALADGTVVPNAVYVSPVGAFRPDAEVGI